MNKEISRGKALRKMEKGHKVKQVRDGSGWEQEFWIKDSQLFSNYNDTGQILIVDFWSCKRYKVVE